MGEGEQVSELARSLELPIGTVFYTAPPGAEAPRAHAEALASLPVAFHEGARARLMARSAVGSPRQVHGKDSRQARSS